MAHLHGGTSCCSSASAQVPSAAPGLGTSSGAHAAPAANGDQRDAAIMATDALLQELEDMALDPALEGCCRRDVLENIRSGHIKRALQGADRAAVRSRLQQQAILSDPAALAALSLVGGRGGESAGQGSGGGALDDSRDTGGAGALSDLRMKLPSSSADERASWSDPELEALRAARLQQLRARAARQEGERAAGHGRLNDVAADKLLDLAEQTGGRLVAHLALEGTQACDHLDEQLAQLAHAYQGTYFARVAVRRRSPAAGGAPAAGSRAAAGRSLQARLGLSELPALLAFRGGAVVGRAPVAQFGGGVDIIEEEVYSYLRRLRVLAEGKSESQRSGGCDEDSEDACSGDDDHEDDDGGQACELCGRTFPHEHVRAMYRGGGDDGGDDSEDDPL